MNDFGTEHNLAEEVFVFPASFAQQRLWFIEQLIPGNSLYTIPLVFRLTGSLNRAALQQSIQAIANRHETLRTSFDAIDGQLVQVISPTIQVSFPCINLETVSTTREKVALEQIRQAIQQPFHLNQEPLFRVQLWQLHQAEYLLLILIHHIIFDEWSSGILIRELGQLYTAFASHQPAKLPELPVQYADFAHWQREWLQGEVLNAQLNYWRQQLKDLPSLNLPSSPRPLLPSYRGASQLIELPQQLLDALEELSQQAGVTLFMTLLAAFQTLLHRYTGQTDIAIGSPIANRHRSELEGVIGFLVNSLVLRTDLAGDPTFRVLIERVRDVTLAAYAHQDVPFEKLVEELQPVRSLSQNPLFQVVFALQNTPMEQLELPGLTLSSVDFEIEATRFDLELYVWKCTGNFRNLWGKGWQQPDGLRGVVIYNTDLFDSEAIASLRHHFQTLLAAIVANPDTRLSRLPLLTTQAQQQLLTSWQNTQTDYPTNICIHQLFEAQVKRQPQAVAVRSANQQFTYHELNQGSNQLARYLQKLEVKGKPVGICLEQTTEIVAAMLAILKAGGAYVPIDASYPPERLHFLLDDAQVSVVLSQKHLVLFNTDKIKVVCLEQEWSAIAQESEENLDTPSNVEQLAYIIYTSGSTGTPKGVMVAHRAVNRLVCQTDYVQIRPGDRIAQVANIAFDAATFEIWGALLNGAELVAIERETALSPTELRRAVQQQQINIMFLTTALFNQTVSQTPDVFQSLKYLLFGGEMANPDSVRTVLQHGKPQHLIHVYGPTENTTFSTWYEVQEVPETTIPIGRAIANTQVYVLDAHLNLVPAGIHGEIYLGGDGLAQGYWNRPELTAKNFIANPFRHGERLYRTGDRAYYRSDGNIEFLGRSDDQVKIRGFRIELGEVEAILAQYPSVKTAVVNVRQLAGDRQLIAYFIPTAPIVSDRELRSFLKTQLPAYMLPAMFVPLKTLPLTTNGKINRQALPLPTTKPETMVVAPSTSIEKSLGDLWCQLLGRKQVGIHDNFFELGGHSLLATQLISRIRDRFQVEIALRSLFETPTIAQIAQKIEAVKKVTSDHLSQRREEIEL